MRAREMETILRWCNAVRAELGREPVKTIEKGRNGGWTCPLAKTIGPDVRVFGSYVQTGDGSVVGPGTSPLVVKFIRRFDAGLEPDYELGGKK